ncbi:MAG: hypothetical protein AAGF23_09675 [Acidobacteriota bacterium]
MGRHRHRHAATLAGAVLAAALTALAAPPAAADDLDPVEDLTRTVFRAPGADTGPFYTRLAPGQRATYRFCGQGELTLSSRAFFAGAGTGRGADADAARYTLDVDIDGARPIRELGYRVTVVGGRFDGETLAGARRRARFEVARGCHAVAISLARTTAPEVAVRLAWTEEAPTLRQWRSAAVEGGDAVVLEVGDRRTPYRLLGAGEELVLDVAEPVWVRLLARPVGDDRPADFTVDVSRGDRPYRSYRLDARPPRRARLDGRPGLPVAGASEVVFPARPGEPLKVRADDRAVIRAQVAERADAAGPGGSWGTRARVSSYYDSNILRYSERFIRRFEDGTDPRRFRVESLDDTITRAEVDLTRRFTGFGGLPAQLVFGLEHRAYTRNSIKDWSRFRAEWRQDLRRGQSVSLRLEEATDFYIRHLRDSDLAGAGSTADPFQALTFSRSEARARYIREVGASSDIRLDLRWRRLDYAETFRELDSDDWGAALRWDHRLGRRTQLSLTVEHLDSSARGFDEPGETRFDSDDSDASHRQLDLVAGARFRLPTERRQSVFLQAEVGRREYTTDRPPAEAPVHSGREDDFLRLYGSWQIDLSPRYQLTVFAQSRERSSTAPVNLDIGIERDYDQWEAGFRVTARYGR